MNIVRRGAPSLVKRAMRSKRRQTPLFRGRERYSASALARHAALGHQHWPQAWRKAQPKKRYDVVIIGGGGHGLATAYHLAKDYGVTDVAVIEKGWIGGGNTGRNTTIVRSNYFYPESAALYDFALQRYERLSQELNFNIMFSQHGVLGLIQSRHQMETARRAYNAMLLNGVDCEFLDTEAVYQRAPALACSGERRYPILGGLLQQRGGTIRHDAVAWGYARAADRLGVDIVENCEVRGFTIRNGQITAIESSLGEIACDKVAMAVAGNSSVVAAMAGVRLPITSYGLQAFVSEPVKPVLDCTLLTYASGVYVSQSDKGELVVGQGLDRYPSYAQRGNTPVIEEAVAGLLDLFPQFDGLKLMRQWAGVVDVSPDSSPIIGKTPIENLYINCGFGTGGFKAIPAGGVLLAETICSDRPHELARPFSLQRFQTGRLIDEASAAGIPH